MDSSPQTHAAADVPAGASRTGAEQDPRSASGTAAAQEAVRQRMGRWIELTSQPFTSVDFEYRIVWANRAYEQLLGAAPGELTHRSLRELTPEPWHGAMYETLSKVRTTGSPGRYEKEYRRSDGTLVAIAVTIDLDREGDVPVGFFAFVTDLSERKAVEIALRESEDRLRRLYDEAPVGYHEIDTEGRIVAINRTECEMLGYSREELLGRWVFDFVAEENRAEAVRAFPEKIRGDQPLRTIERTIVRRDGAHLFVSIEERYKRDEHGRVMGIRSTLQDVTERKRTEAALVASERRARALFEGIEDAVFVHDPDGSMLDVNPAASRLLGYERDELLALTIHDIDAPEFSAGYMERLRTQLTRGHLSCEGWHRSKDGRLIPVDINTSTILFDERRAILAVIRDVTERKALDEARRQLAEEQLRNASDIEAKNLALTASESRYRQLTEGCLDAVVVADCQRRITLFNPAAEKFFGRAADHALNEGLSSLLAPSLRAKFEEDLEGYVTTHQSNIVGHTVELRGVRDNGEEFPLEMSLSAFELAGEAQFIASIRDQTERQRMRAMLVQSEKLASIGLLSAGVAHEINNPLAYVANNLAVLERDMKSILEMIAVYEGTLGTLAEAVPEAHQAIETIAEELDWSYVRDNLMRMIARTREGVQRVANIVQNLRGLARTSPPKMEAASIPDLLESALEMIRGRLRRTGIEVAVEHGDLPRVQCVPSQISQVILNLLINAIQAVESSGRSSGGRIRFATGRDKEMAILSVYDNGCGIPLDSIPRLFDPFYTTKPVGEGTGLGLSITHGIVTGHGGRIDVESRMNVETCFRVFLPLKNS